MDSFDELWPGGPRFAAGGGFRLGTDSVLLAHFINMSRVRRCADLGSGAGVLSVLLALKNPDARIDGVEIQPGSAQAGHENLLINGLEGRCRVITGDLREHRSLLEAGAYDLVVSNPPYFPVGSGKAAPDPGRAAEREERSCTLAELITAAAYLCRWGGSLCLVHRPERLSELFCTMSGAGIEPKRLRLVSAREGSAPSLVLVEGRRGGRPGLTIEPPLVLFAPDGGESDEVKMIYHRGCE